jgi:hypothetical protein
MESYTPIGLHQRLLGEKLIYDFISLGPRRFVSFCIFNSTRVCWLFSSSWRNCEEGGK